MDTSLQQQLTDYLLGKLDAVQQESLEQSCFTDSESFAQLCDAENALIDAYVRDQLTPADRLLFEQRFLTIPARRERIANARAILRETELHSAALSAQPANSPAITSSAERGANTTWSKWLAAWRVPLPVFGLAILLLAIGGWWLMNERRHLRTQLAQAKTNSEQQQQRLAELEQQFAQERSRTTQLNEELTRLRASTSTTATPATALPRLILFTLTAGVLRSDSGSSIPTLALPADAGKVRLQLQLGQTEAARYEAILRTDTGVEIARWKTLQSQRAGN